MKSIHEKVWEAYQLAAEICGLFDPAHVLADLSALSESIQDELWGHVEGLFMASVERCMSGRCSLQAMMDFDVTVVDRELDEAIAKFRTIRVGQ